MPNNQDSDNSDYADSSPRCSDLRVLDLEIKTKVLLPDLRLGSLNPVLLLLIKILRESKRHWKNILLKLKRRQKLQMPQGLLIVLIYLASH